MAEAIIKSTDKAEAITLNTHKACFVADVFTLSIRKACFVAEVICLCWGFTAQSTQWGHVERGQFT